MKKKTIFTSLGLVAAGIAVGAGASLAIPAIAATPSANDSTSTAAPSTPETWHSNTDATHEAGESAAWAAAEARADATGVAPTVGPDGKPFGPHGGPGDNDGDGPDSGSWSPSSSSTPAPSAGN